MQIESVDKSISLNLISSRKEDHNLQIITKSGLLWDTKQQKAIERGNLIHELLSKIKTPNDISFALEDMVLSGNLTKEKLKSLSLVIDEVINHDALKRYFSNEYNIFNEVDIITKTGRQIRPDRLNINKKNEVIIIDYKTGEHKSSYSKQLIDYESILNEMNYKVINKILVYINEEVVVIEV